MENNYPVTPTPQQTPYIVTNQATIIEPASSLDINKNIIQSSPKKKNLVLLITFLIIMVLAAIYGILSVIDKKTGSGIEDAEICFEHESSMMKQYLSEINNISSKEERQKIYCKNDSESFQRLIACLENVRSENSLATDIITAFPKYKNIILETIDTHNSTCPESKISLPLK